MLNSLTYLSTLLAISNPNFSAGSLSSVENKYAIVEIQKDINLSTKTFSLEDRYKEKSVNDVFKDNILLTLHYLNGDVKNKAGISWVNIEKPANFHFSLQPGKSFAFHNQVLPEYKDNLTKTTNAHFNFDDGFKSDGYLTGDGVCHLASLMYWAARDAGLSTYAPTNHDFAVINQVPKEYGVAIYDVPGEPNISSKQNLYITNNRDTTVNFIFSYDGTNLTVKINQDLI